jgi:hypothetical protein
METITIYCTDGNIVTIECFEHDTTDGYLELTDKNGKDLGMFYILNLFGYRVNNSKE